MKILFQYLKPHKWLVFLVLLLAAINISFSLIDPIVFGKLINLATYHQNQQNFSWNEFLFTQTTVPAANGGTQMLYGVVWLLLASITVAMVSRLAKNFQDYFLNVIVQKFGAKVFTDGLQHAMKLPYQEFEDQRSGETLSILQKVRNDTERFVNSFINILFSPLIGIGFLIWYSITKNWALIPVFLIGIVVLGSLTGLLSKKIKTVQRSINRETNKMSGVITESLRNIELVKSLGLTFPEILVRKDVGLSS